MAKKIPIEQKVLHENDRLATDIRRRIKAKGIISLNLVSSPGSGKTSLLENTIRTLGEQIEIAIIAGDVQTENDARRLITAGARLVRPIVTGGACHLDARMVTKAIDQLDLGRVRLLFIENVGNLVCPASYDLGEDKKVVIMSVAEGDDKPLKYPAMFRQSSAVVINKIDLLPYCDFDLARAKENAFRIKGDLKIIETSCRTGEGLDGWYSWVKSLLGGS